MARNATPSMNSMTGFARVDGAHEGYQWVWECRSVNGRGLELRSRIPQGYDDLEINIRKKISKKLARGNINLNLTIRHDGGDRDFNLQHGALENVISILSEVEDTAARAGLALEKPSSVDILQVRGVFEARENDLSEDARKVLQNAIEDSFDSVLEQLAKARQDEGVALFQIIEGQLEQIKKLTDEARNMADGLAEQIRDRLTKQVEDLLAGHDLSKEVPQERIAQEITLLIVKADICEELDRLDAHCSAAQDLLFLNEPMGRKFDFLVQEFNREANTLCSKAATIELKNTGLALKTVIDQMREQIQNIE